VKVWGVLTSLVFSPLGLIGTSALLNAGAQLLLKWGLRGGVDKTMAEWVWGCGQNPFIWAGVACYGTSLLFWLRALARVDLGYGVPLLSLSYVLTTIAGALFFKEPFSWGRVIGIGLIMGGIYCVARTNAS